MNKKILIVFLVVMLATGIFFFFRDNQQTTEAKKVSKEAFVKLTNVAKKIPNAGLTQMGTALNQYYEKHDKYPDQLNDLYPNFIPVKEFIEEVDWYYEVRDNDFFLSKTIIKNNKQMIASIDKKLVPRMGTGAVVATSTLVEKPPEVAVKEDKAATSSLLVTLKPLDLIIEEEEQVESLIEQVEIVSVVEGEISPGVSSSISENFLVWKDENGVLGFGNIKYPEMNKMAIYRNHSWVGLKRPPAPVSENSYLKEQDSPKNLEKTALELNNNFVVWKSKDGKIGVGNLQAPRLDNISALRVDGEWVNIDKIEQELPEFRESLQPTHETNKKNESIEEIAASNYSRNYIVWKDKQGNIGFGNMQGPKMDNVAMICVDGKWIDIQKNFPETQKPIEPVERTVEKETTSEEITKQLSNNYLVWRDKAGNMGYGNMQTPRTDDVSSIYIDGRWVNVEKEHAVDLHIQPQRTKFTKKDTDQIALDYSDNYLVWKDKNGRIGFGNVAYPKIDDIAYIHINGSWQEIAN